MIFLIIILVNKTLFIQGILNSSQIHSLNFCFTNYNPDGSKQLLQCMKSFLKFSNKAWILLEHVMYPWQHLWFLANDVMPVCTLYGEMVNRSYTFLKHKAILMLYFHKMLEFNNILMKYFIHNFLNRYTNSILALQEAKYSIEYRIKCYTNTIL